MPEAITHIDGPPSLQNNDGGVLITYPSGGEVKHCWMSVASLVVYQRRMERFLREHRIEQTGKIQQLKRRRTHK